MFIACLNFNGCRFSKAAVFPYSERLNIHCRIGTSMLSSGIMYAASLVFSYQKGREDALVESSKLVRLNWKCEKLNISSTHIAERSRYGWLKIRLWHFIHGHTNADFHIVLDKISYFKEEQDISNILLHHIEFEPVPMVIYVLLKKKYYIVPYSFHCSRA